MGIREEWVQVGSVGNTNSYRSVTLNSIGMVLKSSEMLHISSIFLSSVKLLKFVLLVICSRVERYVLVIFFFTSYLCYLYSCTRPIGLET